MLYTPHLCVLLSFVMFCIWQIVLPDTLAAVPNGYAENVNSFFFSTVSDVNVAFASSSAVWIAPNSSLI